MQNILIQNITKQEFRELINEVVMSAVKSTFKLPPSPAPSDKLLTKKEAGAYLKISPPTLSRYVKLGYVKAHTVSGTRMRFKAADLDKALRMLFQGKQQ